MEIYNEQIIDLLSGSIEKIHIREDRKNNRVYPEPCIEETVENIKDVLDLIDKGSSNRKVASTQMNNESSRSHAIFTANIQTTQKLSSSESIIKTSRLHIVDLAGSERCKETGAAN